MLFIFPTFSRSFHLLCIYLFTIFKCFSIYDINVIEVNLSDRQQNETDGLIPIQRSNQLLNRVKVPSTAAHSGGTLRKASRHIMSTHNIYFFTAALSINLNAF